MKYYFILSVCLAILCNSCANVVANTSDDFKVWGNCNMCKKNIETALHTKGVKASNWNKETKMIHVEFDSTVIKLDGIQKLIAAAGYDTDLFNADLHAYNNLHECCQYEWKPH
jgi:periplasmic mercuric ion binding protein